MPPLKDEGILFCANRQDSPSPPNLSNCCKLSDFAAKSARLCPEMSDFSPQKRRNFDAGLGYGQGADAILELEHRQLLISPRLRREQ
jgi:hypothetical protein